MQKEMTLLMLKRRGKKDEITSNGSTGMVEWYRTEDALLIFVEHGKVTIDVVKTILGLSKPTDVLTIVVYNKPPTPDAKHALEKLGHISTFTYDEMAFDLIQIVPHHSLVVGPKPKEWHKFPIILTSDVVARYYAFRRGDVIRVVEDDDTISFKRVV